MAANQSARPAFTALTRERDALKGKIKGPLVLRWFVIIPAALIFLAAGIWLLIEVPAMLVEVWLPNNPTAKDTGATLLAATQSILFALGGFIAVIGVVLSLFRHGQDLRAATLAQLEYAHAIDKELIRIEEAEESLRINQERALRARFADIADLLTDSQSAVKQIAGIYALAGLANDWATFGKPAERQVCIDVLCAFLRTPVDLSGGSQIGSKAHQVGYSVIRQHLVEPSVKTSWQGCIFSLQNLAVNHEVNLSGVHIERGTELLMGGARVGAGGIVRLDHISGSGLVDLSDFLAAEELRDQSTGRVVLDLSFAKLDDADIRLIDLRLDGALTVTFSRSTLTRTAVAVGGKSWVRHGEFRFDPDLMSGGSLSVLRMALLEGGLLSLRSTSFRDNCQVSIRNIEVKDASSVLIGDGFGLYGDPFRRRQISFSDGSTLAAGPVVVRDAGEFRVDGVELTSGSDLSLVDFDISDEGKLQLARLTEGPALGARAAR